MSDFKMSQEHRLGKAGDYVVLFFSADQICMNSLFSCSLLEANPLTVMLNDTVDILTILTPLCLPISVLLTYSCQICQEFPHFVLPFPVKVKLALYINN
jgi:hypothetical protein